MITISVFSSCFITASGHGYGYRKTKSWWVGSHLPRRWSFSGWWKNHGAFQEGCWKVRVCWRIFFFFFFHYLISWEMETQRDVFCSVKFWHLDSSCCQLQSFICYFLFFEAWIFTIVHSYPNRLVLDADNIPMVLPFVHTGMQEIMPIGASVPRIRKTVSRLTGNVLLVEDSKQQARQLLLIHSSFRPLLPSLNLDFTISPIF